MPQERDYLEWPTDFPEMWRRVGQEGQEVRPSVSYNDKEPDRWFAIHEGRLYALLRDSHYKRPELAYTGCYRTEPFDDPEILADLQARHEKLLAWTAENPGAPGALAPIPHSSSN
jgi:hypothetical protein